MHLLVSRQTRSFVPIRSRVPKLSSFSLALASRFRACSSCTPLSLESIEKGVKSIVAKEAGRRVSQTDAYDDPESHWSGVGEQPMGAQRRLEGKFSCLDRKFALRVVFTRSSSILRRI
jgi:methylphosphotriester-DNA--protein-cysteine methyltransferase